MLTPTCVWRATPAVIVALDQRFGEPVDAYVNGSQVWLRDDGPGGFAVEWRLHPVAGYRRPETVDVHELFPLTAHALLPDVSGKKCIAAAPIAGPAQLPAPIAAS